MRPSTKMLMLTRRHDGESERVPYPESRIYRNRNTIGDDYPRDTYDEPEMRRGRGANGRYVHRAFMPPRPPMIGYDRDPDGEYTGERMSYEDDYPDRRPPRMTYGTERGAKSVRYGNAYDGDIYARGSIVMSPSRHDDDDGETYFAPVDERTAHKWAKKLKNSDGSAGAHWTAEQLEPLRASLAPNCDKWELFVAANMMYSDYAKVAQKYGADRPEFYVEMAKAFLTDPDARDNKLRRYIETVSE